MPTAQIAVTAQRGAAKATPAQARISPTRFALVLAQLVAVLLVVRQFQIEGKAFVELMAFTLVGFAVHAVLPLVWRLPFFALLSVGSIAFVLGLANAIWIVGIGAVLVGICHAPVAIRWRALLLIAVGVLLAVQRAALLPVPWSEAIWPILGSMFMFRLIVYFYDLRHDKAPIKAAQSAGYFAMLPNVCFPLFPVVDFKTWRRSHYSADAYATYQKGIDWIVRGIIHLILYRLFYYHVTLAPSEVAAPDDLLQYLVANFMLYLRVSGLFHLVVGMLHLFGFALPETHNRYLLASSFTDFWRRINIYWKDFMQKIFYFPAVFALKRLGTTRAVIVATLYVFVLTWFLHSYQWFWLRGSWLFVWQDMLFWALLGVLVVLNSLWEIKHGRQRSLGAPTWNLRSAAAKVAWTFATFWFICVLWSFWTAESIGDWLSMWSALSGPLSWQIVIFPLLTLSVIVLGNIPGETERSPQAKARRLSRERATTVAALVLLLALSWENLHSKFDHQIATVIHSLRSAHLSRLDNAKLERGYYEGLLDVGRFNSQLWEVYSKKPANWLAADMTGLKRFTDDMAQYELVPSSVATSQYGAITTNRLGLRDRDYPPQRPANTWRIAVLGPSNVMGWGVPDGGAFEALLEVRLAQSPLGGAGQRFELLNFGVPGYQPPQQLVNQERAIRLEANVLMYVATGRESTRSANYLAELIAKGIPVPYPELQALIHRAGATPAMDQNELERRLLPMADEILAAVYREIARRGAATGQQLVWVFLPQVRAGAWQEETSTAIRMAKEAGFETISLDDLYAGQDLASIRLAEWDDHPNALAHRLIADRLYQELAARADTLFPASTR